MPQHLNWIYVRALTWPLQNLNCIFLQPFRGGLAGVFGIIVLLHNPSVLEHEVQPQTITLPLACLTFGMMLLFIKCCVDFTPDVTGHALSKKFNFCLISPQNICPKALGIFNIYFGKCETSLFVIFGQQWLLPCISPMDAVFAHSLSYC